MANRKSNENHNGEKEREMVMNILLNEPTLSFGEMAEKCGMSRDQFYKVRTSEGFYEEYHQKCLDRFRSLEQKAIDAMAKLIDHGNYNAAKYVLDGLDYGASQKVDVTANNIKISIGGDDDDEQA